MNRKEHHFWESFYDHNRFNFLIAVLLNAVMALMGIFISWTLGEVVDAVSTSDSDALRCIAIIMGIGTPCFLLIDLLGQRAKSKFIHKGLHQYKERAFRAIAEKSISEFNEENTGTYLSALTNDIASIEENYLNRSVSLLYYVLEFTLTLGVMLYYSPLLTLSVIILCLLPVIVSLVLGKGLQVDSRIY